MRRFLRLAAALLWLACAPPALAYAQSPNACPPVYVWASERGHKTVTPPTRAAETTERVTALYPEPEFTAGGGPYTLRWSGGMVTFTADAGQPPELGNDWIRLDQGSQIAGNFPPGTRCLMFPNAQTVTLTFAPAVQGVSVALGRSDYGRENFSGAAYNGNTLVASASLSGEMTASTAGQVAPTLTVTAPPGQHLTSLVIRCPYRPQFGLLLGPLTLTP